MSQIMYNYPAMMAHAGDMAGYAGTLQSLGADIASEPVNRPGMSGDSSSWKGWGHVRWFIEEVPAGAA
ncbi:MmpS family membrane protein [Mycobacterium tuberculosis]|nr:MmpS family membrane protein [Mycobacterium tuberculosis]